MPEGAEDASKKGSNGRDTVAAEASLTDEESKEEMTLGGAMALRDINLNIRHGEFVCIIGDVSSGKSSLLSAIIGDLLYLDSEYVSQNEDLIITDPLVARSVKQYSQKKLSPTDAPILVSEPISYVQQNPWI